MLNIGKRSFVHVKYGDTNKIMDVLPDQLQLSNVRKIFLGAMSGTPLAVTNHLAEAKNVQFDMDDLFQRDKYRNVNITVYSMGPIQTEEILKYALAKGAKRAILLSDKAIPK